LFETSTDLVRFQLESPSYGDLVDVLQVAREAFDVLDPEEQEQDLLADICASTGLMWAHRGLFNLAEPFLRQADEIRASIDPFDHLELGWTEVNLGNLTASTSRYEEALEFQLKALRNRQVPGGDGFVVTTPQRLLFQNLGRSQLLLGRFLESHVWCHMAIGVLSESQNWGMLA
jgi:tetratricopeptide (TPR) repeat protein